MWPKDIDKVIQQMKYFESLSQGTEIEQLLKRERQFQSVIESSDPLRSAKDYLTLIQADATATSLVEKAIDVERKYPHLFRMSDTNSFEVALRAAGIFASISNRSIETNTLLGLTNAFLGAQDTSEWFEVAKNDTEQEVGDQDTEDEDMKPFLLMDAYVPSQVGIKIVRLIDGKLIEYLKSHPDALYKMGSRQFEVLIAEILAGFGWRVQLTSHTKDGGYDIFGINKDSSGSGVEQHWIIECKKYRKDRKVGIDIANAVFGVKSKLGVANAMLVTTSDFTRGVKEFKASRYDFDLRNFEAILEWLNKLKPHPGGGMHLKEQKLRLPENR